LKREKLPATLAMTLFLSLFMALLFLENIVAYFWENIIQSLLLLIISCHTYIIILTLSFPLKVVCDQKKNA
jgi:hypothetical protein